MTSKKFDELKAEGKIPRYLLDIEIDYEIGPVTRGKLAKDTHLVENTVEPQSEDVATPVNTEELDDNDEEEGAVADLLSDTTLRQLGALHDQQKLLNPEIPVSYTHLTLPTKRIV